MSQHLSSSSLCNVDIRITVWKHKMKIMFSHLVMCCSFVYCLFIRWISSYSFWILLIYLLLDTESEDCERDRSILKRKLAASAVEIERQVNKWKQFKMHYMILFFFLGEKYYNVFYFHWWYCRGWNASPDRSMMKMK